MRGRRLVAAAAASLVLAGCASSTVQEDGTTNHYLADALSLWTSFPAGSSPRPLVLTGPAINDPSTGFRDGDDKLAYIAGHFTLATALPRGSSTWQQQPLITADQALADLRSSGQVAEPTSASLSITAVRLGTATFSTDRGKRSLPAWVFSFAGVRDPASVLAIAPANRWPKAPRPGADTQDLVAKIAPGGDSVTITFTGAGGGTGPCDEQYQGYTAQSSSAVSVAIRELPGAASQSSNSNGLTQACDLIGYRREVTVTLTPVLGGRVLIDSYGAPLPAG